jgi:hypothetical protein
MATLDQQLQPISALRSQRDLADQQVYADGIRLQKLQSSLQQAMQTNPGQTGDLQQQVSTLQATLATNRQGLTTVKENLNQAILGMYANDNPQQLASQLSDDIPIALFPVRIETRFNTGGKQPELWLRIYPDDIAIETMEKTLTDSEVGAGTQYWTVLFNAITGGAADAEDLKKTAWSNLVGLFGSGRSAWVAMQTKPTNWKDDGSGIADATQLVFPVFDLTKTQAWSRAPRTNTMPDKFVVMCYTGDTKALEITGNLVPDELIVGPDPLDVDNGFVTTGNSLGFGPDFNWASDFDQAVSIGMGFRIPLTTDQARTGFDRILVLGLYLSRSQSDSQQVLEDLIDNHHYSPQGFGLLPQGSPTNNTSQDSSAFTKSDPFDNISYFVETGKPLFDADTDCDGRNLADALGIGYDTLQFIANTDGTDRRDAILMNQALYPGTLGYYVNSLLDPVLNAQAQQWLQVFFTQFVTGRGPLPAFRVGNQPYGVLLTSDFSAWKWQERESAYPAAFLTTLYNILNDYLQIWKGLEAQLQYAGKPGQDPSAVLMNILGLQPGSASFFQRNAYSTDNLYNLAAFQYGGRYFADMQNNFTSKGLGLDWFKSFGYNVVDGNGVLQVPQILRLVYQHFTTTLDPTNLVDNLPLSETDPIHFYDSAGQKNYLDWLAAANSIDDLQQQNFGNGIAPPTALLYLMLRKSLLQSLHTASVHWFGANSVDLSDTLGAINFHNIRPGGTLTKWEVMRAPVGTAIPAHPQAQLSIADYLLGPGITDANATIPASIKAALAELAHRPAEDIARCFTEHIDTLTYRLDSWQTAMFTLRLQELRKTPVSNDKIPRNTGIWLGAYGWVENVRPASRTQVSVEQIPEALRPANNAPVYEYADNGGYVHTPSINHASAAAILRSGYLSHASMGSPDALAVNLSSDRVRNALLIMDGIRSGQPIEALLGYQFERGLHDQASADNSLLSLNGYIYDFRDQFPIAQTVVQQQGNTPQETIPANDVVNGLTLSQTALAFPYGATGSVTSATTAEIAAIETEKDKLDDTLDAVKDLLTTESVYQLVLGNFDRAGSVINSLQDATAPPVLDSIDTPRGSNFTFTNRVSIQFSNGDPAAQATNPWYPVPMTARAILETGLNKWLASILGDPASLAAQVAQQDSAGNLTRVQVITLDQLGIQPIDLVYMVGSDLSTGSPRANQENTTGSSELESRIAYFYRSANGLADEGIVNIAFLKPQGVPGKIPLGGLLPVIRTLKSMVTDSRYLNAQDFNTPAQTGLADPNNPKGYDTTELTARINAAKTAFEQRIQGLQTIPITATITDAQGNTTIYGNLDDTFTALDTVKQDFSGISFDFQDADAATLQRQLIAIANGGLGDAFPQRTLVNTDPFKQVILEQGRSIARRMLGYDKQATDLLTQAAAMTDPAKMTETLIKAGQAFMGDVFNIIPQFKYNNESDILQSDADRDQLLSFASGSLAMDFPADEWMQNAASVRPRLARWDYARTLAEVGNIQLAVKPVQIPYKEKDSWIAVEFPATDPLNPGQPFTLTQDTLSIAIHGDQAFVAGAAHAGLLVDDWTETIPTSEEITGISFNFNQPNAFPPQAILLAVPPQINGQWDWNGLIGILTDTLQRARLRAVEPQMLATANKVETSVLLPALLANFTQTDLDIALDYRTNIRYVKQEFPIEAVAVLGSN